MKAGQGSAATTTEREERGRLWVQAEGADYVRPISVQFGATDGSFTEVQGKELSEGMEVVVGEARNEQVQDATTNPFAPKLFGNRKKSE